MFSVGLGPFQDENLKDFCFCGILIDDFGGVFGVEVEGFKFTRFLPASTFGSRVEEEILNACVWLNFGALVVGRIVSIVVDDVLDFLNLSLSSRTGVFVFKIRVEVKVLCF